MFVDKVSIFVTAGRGGDGCISFRREKYIPLGGPDGGNGGKGGDVFLEVNPHLSTLLDFTYKPHFKAKDGNAGQGSNKYGRGGEELVIKVPPGTVVFNNNKIIADLKENAQKILIAKGGRGGRGNASFKTSRNTAPRISEKGEPGQKVTLKLELRLIADVGLVGFPNAGKSTFLKRITSANPKIADYPFTTLSPNLGVSNHKGRSFVIADIPGLIEGAHRGKGLGDEFLRHVKRTRVLIHIIDVFGYENKPAYKNYRTINKELLDYSKHLAEKPMVIAANKMDLTGSDKKLEQLKKHLKGNKIFPVSSATGAGIKDLLNEVIRQLSKAFVEEEMQQDFKEYVYEPEFKIEKTGGIFVLTGPKIERLGFMTNFTQEESLLRFQKILEKMGVDKQMEKMGAVEGDVVRIGEQEFTYEK
ncbi:MAG: GTPase ObgE [Elusimicrobia bacterium]|nr:GTPase ObgE [Candidatus Liberimonas magnetica]